jgi:S1-C subfamily serine protease
MRNHYEILDVRRDASAVEIKAAYRFQLKAFHSDKFSTGSIHAERAQERIRQIVEAHRTLSEAGSRAEYDRFLVHTSPHDDQKRHEGPATGIKGRGARAVYFSILEAIALRLGKLRDKVDHSFWLKGFLWFLITVAVLILVGIWYLPTKQNPPRTSRKLETALVQNEPVANSVSRLQASAVIPQDSSPTTTGTPSAFDLPMLARNARKAVLTILAYDAQGKIIQTGSGFFISNDGRLVTNRHVINNAINAFAKTEDGANYRVTGTLTSSASLDLAVLKAEAKQVPFLVIQSVAPEVGSRIAIIGSPSALEGSLSEGIVSAIRAEDDGTWIQITAPISPGSSGSPVLDSRGQVVGVVTRGSSGRFQNLNFARSSQDLMALMERLPNGAKPRLLSDLPSEKENTPPSASPPATDQRKYRVVGLPKRTPFLNVRAGPGANFAVVAVFTPMGRGITLGPGRVTNGTTVWQEIYSGSFHGWVNAEYIEPETQSGGGGDNLDFESK